MNTIPHTIFPLQNVDVVPPLGPRYPVPGSNVSLCPPHDYSWNERNRAWESTQYDGRIKVLQFKGQSFIERKARLEQILVPDEQVEWQERRDGYHAGYPCLHLAFRKSIPTLLSDIPELSCHRVMAFGNDEVLILSTATFPAHTSKKTEGEILASMLSAVYHPEGIYGDFPAHARFNLDLQPARLTWVESTQVSPDGPFVFSDKRDKESPGIQVTVEIKKGQPKNPKQAVEFLFQQNFFSSYQILEIQPLQVKEYAGYEGYAIEQHTVQENNRLEYVAILRLPDSYITFSCIASDDRISHLSTFRRLVQSYQPI